MITIYDSATMARVLSGPIDPDLKVILLDRLALLYPEFSDWDLRDLAHFIVVDPGDCLDAIEREMTFSPMVSFDGHRFPDERFTSGMWEFCIARKGYFDLTFVLSDSGPGLCLLVPNRNDVVPELLALINAYGTK